MADARRKILCIEDDRETAALIAEELVERGFEVAGDKVDQLLNACRARSFQRPSWLTQICRTPIFATTDLPSTSASTAATWRTIASLPASTVIGSARTIDL